MSDFILYISKFSPQNSFITSTLQPRGTLFLVQTFSISFIMNSFLHIIPEEFPPCVQVRTQETLIFQLGDSKCPVVAEVAHKNTSEIIHVDDCKAPRIAKRISSKFTFESQLNSTSQGPKHTRCCYRLWLEHDGGTRTCQPALEDEGYSVAKEQWLGKQMTGGHEPVMMFFSGGLCCFQCLTIKTIAGPLQLPEINRPTLQ